MASVIVDKIVQRTGIPELIETLSERISSSELNSLLLEVFHRKAGQYTPSDLLRLYQQNRFVKPANTPVIEMKETELSLLKIFEHNGYEPLELSPVSILGSCSVVAPADQKKVLSALRGTEVLADATNAIALQVSDLKKRKLWVPHQSKDKLRYCTIQRHVRTQAITGKGFTPHFKIGCLVTAGLDAGNFTFEKESLAEHIRIMKNIFMDFYKVTDISFRLLCRDGYADAQRLASAIRDYVVSQAPDTRIIIEEIPEKQIAYYQGIQYKVDIKVKERWFEIGDGGFVNWTQQLLQNNKERYLITGFGFEFMYRIMKGHV